MSLAALALLLAVSQSDDALDHRRVLATFSCAQLDSLLVQQSRHIVHLMDAYERNCRPGMETGRGYCRALSTALIEARSDADDVEYVLDRKCGGADEP